MGRNAGSARRPHARRGLSLRGGLAAALGLLAAGVASAQPSVQFDHFRTGFPLTGAHERVPCETCHAGGVFQGTPTSCGACHVPGSPRASTAKPQNHIPTSNMCGDCHVVTTWSSVRFDHRDVSGSCLTCHTGAMATGKPPNHVITTQDCGTCHLTLAWTPVHFDHSGITTGCFQCHNGTTATGKPANHPATSNDCEQCHNTRNWSSVRFDHTGITTGCFQCHNGSAATGKPGNHPPSTNDCEMCHNTRSWANARFDHSGVTGNCMSCHDGTTATGKGPGHFVTSQDCNVCHNTTAWTPVLAFRHTSPNYPDHGSRLQCTDCHTANSEVVNWRFPAFQPDCAACHYNNFKPDAHRKTETPQTFYTASELRDCAGACHTYTDTTLTTISRSRSGHHSPRQSGWD